MAQEKQEEKFSDEFEEFWKKVKEAEKRREGEEKNNLEKKFGVLKFVCTFAHENTKP